MTPLLGCLGPIDRTFLRKWISAVAAESLGYRTPRSPWAGGAASRAPDKTEDRSVHEIYEPIGDHCTARVPPPDKRLCSDTRFSRCARGQLGVA